MIDQWLTNLPLCGVSFTFSSVHSHCSYLAKSWCIIDLDFAEVKFHFLFFKSGNNLSALSRSIHQEVFGLGEGLQVLSQAFLMH